MESSAVVLPGKRFKLWGGTADLTQPILWGSMHGLNDFITGFMLANYTYSHDYTNAVTMLVIYSIIGFGGQLPLGFWMDKTKRIEPFAISSIILLLLAGGCYFIDPTAAIVVAGIAGAGIHVTGGTVCLQVNEGRSGPLGVFTAPGVVGLALGGFFGRMSIVYLLIPLLFIVLLAVAISFFKIPPYQAQNKNRSELDAHDWIMMAILLIMCFRSFIYDLVNNTGLKFENGALILGISAFAGKLIGGYLADRIGWKKYVYFSLPLAFLLLQVGHDNLYCLAFGTACLQSSVPLTLMMMSRSLPRFPATATALSLGVSVAIAGLFFYYYY